MYVSQCTSEYEQHNFAICLFIFMLNFLMKAYARSAFVGAKLYSNDGDMIHTHTVRFVLAQYCLLLLCYHKIVHV